MDSHKAFCQQDRIYIILRKQAQFEIAPEEKSLELSNSFYQNMVPKLLSALHITKNRTTLPGKDA